MGDNDSGREGVLEKGQVSYCVLERFLLQNWLNESRIKCQAKGKK